MAEISVPENKKAVKAGKYKKRQTVSGLSVAFQEGSALSVCL